MRDIAYYIILPILICVLVPIDILIASIFIAYHLMLLYVMISIDYKYKLQVQVASTDINIDDRNRVRKFTGNDNTISSNSICNDNRCIYKI